MNRYLSNLYKVLFELDFEGVKETTTILMAIGTLFWTSLFLYVVKSTNCGGFSGDLLYFSGLIFYVTGIFIVWFFSALFFEFVGKIYNKAGKLRMLLTLSSYSLLPYIFMAPFELMKKFSDTGYFLGTKFELLLFLWVILIYAHALCRTYDLDKTSSYMLVFLPVVTLIFSFIWLIGSIFNLGYIYTV